MSYISINLSYVIKQFILKVFLSAAEGQRPKNYLSYCSCLIFASKLTRPLSLFAILLFFLSFHYFLSPYLSIILLYMSTYQPMSTNLCLSTYNINTPTPTNLRQHTYPYQRTSTYLPTYINTPTQLWLLTNACQPTIIYLLTSTNP